MTQSFYGAADAHLIRQVSVSFQGLKLVHAVDQLFTLFKQIWSCWWQAGAFLIMLTVVMISKKIQQWRPLEIQIVCQLCAAHIASDSMFFLEAHGGTWQRLCRYKSGSSPSPPEAGLRALLLSVSLILRSSSWPRTSSSALFQFCFLHSSKSSARNLTAITGKNRVFPWNTANLWRSVCVFHMSNRFLFHIHPPICIFEANQFLDANCKEVGRQPNGLAPRMVSNIVSFFI